MRRRAVLLAPIGAAGCSLFRRRVPPPPPALHAVVGRPYQAGGVWRYPASQAEYDETGLAVVIDAHAPLMADGAAYDPTSLVAAHPTLQLPSLARVVNLETGREITLRLDDRGPAQPGRILALSPRAALLLGAGSEPGLLRVQVTLDAATTARMLAALGGDPDVPRLAIIAAPQPSVAQESLPPPGSHEPPTMTSVAPPIAAAGVEGPSVPLRLPERVVQGAPRPGALYVDLGGVGRLDAARRLKARAGLGALVVTDFAARPEVALRVRIGPLPNAAAADRAFWSAFRAGIADPRIIVA